MINRKHNKWNEPGMRDIRKNKMSQMFAKPYAYNVSTESDITTISKHNMSQMFINPYDYSLLPGEIPYAK
ncbi:hypothetical protein DPMN_184255 [Dreissena polymorpha]|uniref:Uncharacterized protein n=1 Tax=Dreissena polymorpha TaxID=45954 RepID=A0A9D4DJN5_DREPO|nr:hypothetical protein DPMN_184255 [Dreissena polymorpha]